MLGHNLPLKELLPSTAQVSLGPLGTLGDVHADTIGAAWLCMVIILAGCAIVRPMLVADGPGNKGQGLLEMMYGFVADLTKGQIGHEWRTFFPLIAAIFMFVLTANFIGVLVPWKWIGETITGWPKSEHGGHLEAFEVASPTTDFNVTAGLAVISLLVYLGSGFWAHGAKYLKLYLNPIEWLDVIIRPSTLALRLMMVITADEIMRAAALMLVPVLLPAGVMGFELFIGIIQAFVFALLTSIYIGLTVSHH